MLIRKNTRAFKTIAEMVAACQDRADREKLIRLYITKAGHSIQNRINVEGIQGEAAVFYEMNFQAIVINLKSSSHQLHQSDDIPGIYFFRNTSNRTWDETPFEFDESARKLFGDLPDFPVVRKKDKPGKFIFPVGNKKPDSKPVRKEKIEIKKAVRPVNKGPKQPDYRLRHKIHFTDLERIVDRQSRLTKKDVLDYYSKVADYILPYLKDRPVLIRAQTNDSRIIDYTSMEALVENRIEVPDWIQRNIAAKNKEKENVILCNDKDHLLWYIEAGALGFNTSHGRIKSLEFPDYVLIGIESSGVKFGDAIDVAFMAKDILSGLKLPSFVKTDGMSGLQVYIPLDAKGKQDTGKNVAEYISKLIRLKAPDLITLKGSDNYTYGKVSLDYLINEDKKNVAAPYSFVAGTSSVVSTPLLWEEVGEGLRPEAFNHETILKRLTQIGDPFENLLKKKVNALALLDKMETYYSFLL